MIRQFQVALAVWVIAFTIGCESPAESDIDEVPFNDLQAARIMRAMIPSGIWSDDTLRIILSGYLAESTCYAMDAIEETWSTDTLTIKLIVRKYASESCNVGKVNFLLDDYEIVGPYTSPIYIQYMGEDSVSFTKKVNVVNYDPGLSRIKFYSRHDDRTRGSQAFVVNNDGTDLVNLSYAARRTSAPSSLLYTPNGEKFIFVDDAILYSLSLDGKSKEQISTFSGVLANSLEMVDHFIAFEENVYRTSRYHLLNLETGQESVHELPSGSFNPVGLSPSVDRVTSGFYNGSTRTRSLFVYDLASATTDTIFTTPGFIVRPTFFPSGQKIVFSHSPVSYDSLELFIIDEDGKNLVQLSHNFHQNFNPRFTSDGSQIIFDSYTVSTGTKYLSIIDIDGSNEGILTEENWSVTSSSISPRGSKILVSYDVIGSEKTDKSYLAEMVLPDGEWRTLLEGSQIVNIQYQP